MARRIAIVEDETALAQNYRDALEREGYVVDVHPDRPTAQQAFEARLPDLAIIDIQLGDEPKGGHELCRSLRAASRTLPIMFLTARDGEIDEIVGLSLGADDYLSKAITMPQLSARVAALLRKVDAFADADSQNNLIEHGPLTLDIDRITVRWRNEIVELTVTEFWIVRCLAQHPGHVKSRQQLMDAAEIVVDDQTINSHIKRIRKKFRDTDPQADPIKTDYAMGYSWRS